MLPFFLRRFQACCQNQIFLYNFWIKWAWVYHASCSTQSVIKFLIHSGRSHIHWRQSGLFTAISYGFWLITYGRFFSFTVHINRAKFKKTSPRMCWLTLSGCHLSIVDLRRLVFANCLKYSWTAEQLWVHLRILGRVVMALVENAWILARRLRCLWFCRVLLYTPVTIKQCLICRFFSLISRSSQKTQLITPFLYQK